MADLVNLYSESGRNIIGDDSTPALTLENSSTGEAFQAKSATATTNPVVELIGQSGCAPTVAVLKITSSTASQAAFAFAGSCLKSTASGSPTVYGAIRVKAGDKYGWIPFYENIA